METIYYNTIPDKAQIEKDYMNFRIVGSCADECKEAGLSFMNYRISTYLDIK